MEVGFLHPAKLSKGFRLANTLLTSTGTRLEAGTHLGKSVQQGIRAMGFPQEMKVQDDSGGHAIPQDTQKARRLSRWDCSLTLSVGQCARLMVS